MSQSFSFPVLNDVDLLPCLADLEVFLDAAAMAKPSYEVLRPVLEQIVINLTGVTRDDLVQPNFKAWEVFEYPDLHDESIPTNNFMRQLAKLMVACEVHDFSWRDVFKPDPVRLRRHLSAVVNFAKFREEKLASFQECEASVSALAAEQAVLEEKYAADVALLKQLLGERAAHQAEVSAVDAEDAVVVAHNQQLNLTNFNLQAEVRALKATVNQLTDQASQAKMDLSTLMHDIEQSRDQVVQSPEKFRKAITDIQQEADKRRAYLATMASTSRDNERRSEALAKFDKELKRCLKLLDDLEYEVGRKKEAKQGLKDVRAAISADERRLREVMNAHAALRRQTAACGDKFNRLETQASLKHEAALSLVTQQTKEKEAIEAENAAVGARTAEGDAQIRTIRERMAELQQGHDAQIRGAGERYGMLRKVVGEFNRRLEATLDVPPLPRAQHA